MSVHHPETSPTRHDWLVVLVSLSWIAARIVGNLWVLVPLTAGVGVATWRWVRVEPLLLIVFNDNGSLMMRLDERLERRQMRGCALMSGGAAALVPMTVFVAPSILTYWGGVLVVILGLAAIAALVTVAYSNSDQYALLQLTPVSADRLAAMFWRWLLRFAVSLLAIEALMIGMAASLSSVAISDGIPRTAPTDLQIGLLALSRGSPHDLEIILVLQSAAGALWGMSLVAIGLGIAVGLWWRNIFAALAAALAVGVLTVFGALAALFAVPVPGGSELDWLASLAWPLLCLTPFLLTLVLMRWSRRLARRIP